MDDEKLEEVNVQESTQQAANPDQGTEKPDAKQQSPEEFSPPEENREQSEEHVYSEEELNDLFNQAELDDRSDEMSDILLVLDQEKNEVRAVKGVDKDGNLETVPATEEHNNDFLKLDRGGDVLSNFLSNFISQAKDPTRVKFFKVPDKISGLISKLFQRHKDNPEEAITKVMKKHEITPELIKEILEKMEQEKNNPEKKNEQVEGPNASATKQAEQSPASNNSTKQTVTPEVNPQGTAEQSQPEAKQYRFDPDKIDWDSVKAFGLTKDKLVKANVLDTLLQGYKSPGLHYVSVHLGGAVLNSDARLSLRERKDGTIYMAIEGVKRKPEFHFPFMGHEFSDDDAKNLAQTKNMGRIVDLVHPNTGEIVPSIISVDHLTNGFVACPAEKIRVPDEIGNLKLTNEQKAELSQGKAVYLEGMISKKGEPFDCPVQFNAEKRYVEYLFEDRGKLAIEAHKELHKNDIPHEFRGKEITDEQHKKLEQGGSVYLSGIVAKSGTSYDGFLAWDMEKGKPNFVMANKYEEALKAGKIPAYDGEPITPTPAAPKEAMKSEADLPNKYKDHIYTSEEKKTLFEGGTIYVSDLIGKNTNKPYQGYMVWNFQENKPDFMFPTEYHKRLALGEVEQVANQPQKKQEQTQANATEDMNKVPGAYRNHKLPESDQNELANGGTIKISGKTDKNGEPYVGYITWKPEAGFRHMFESEYKAALEQEKVKPAADYQTQVAVNSEGKTNEATKHIDKPLQTGQVAPTEAQAEQKQEKKNKNKQSNDNNENKPAPKKKRGPKL